MCCPYALQLRNFSDALPTACVCAPHPSASHEPHRPMPSVCGKCPLVSFQPHNPNRLSQSPRDRIEKPYTLANISWRSAATSNFSFSLEFFFIENMHGENSKQCLCHHRFSKAGLCGFRGKRQLRIPLQMGRFHMSPPKSCCRTSRELPKWALGSGTETAPAASLAEPTPGFHTTHNTPTSSSSAVLESGFSKPNFCTSNYDLSKQIALYVCS